MIGHQWEIPNGLSDKWDDRSMEILTDRHRSVEAISIWDTYLVEIMGNHTHLNPFNRNFKGIQW